MREVKEIPTYIHQSESAKQQRLKERQKQLAQDKRQMIFNGVAFRLIADASTAAIEGRGSE